MGTANNYKGKITEDSIEELFRIPMKEVVQALWPNLTIKGNSCSCPLSNHPGDDKTPSFAINPETNLFKCFSDGQSGSNFELVADAFNLDRTRDFRECAEKLAELMNVQLNYEPLNEKDVENAKEREQAYKATSFAQKQYRAAFNRLYDQMEKLEQEEVPFEKWPDTCKTLKERGISREFAAEKGIGYAPTDNQFLYKRVAKKGDDAVNAALLAGLINQNASGRYYDFFIGRITYPCVDYRTKNITGFTGRRVSKDPATTAPKYKNSGNNSIYNKTMPSALYGFQDALENSSPEFYDKSGRLRCLLYLEGPNDVTSAQKAGVPAVCSNGTAVSDRQIQTMLNYTNEFIIGLDSDDAGMKAASKLWLMALEHSNGKPVTQLSIPDGRKDLGEMIPSEIKQSIANRFGPARAIVNTVRMMISEDATMPGNVNAVNAAQRISEEFLRNMPDGLEKAKACQQLEKALGVKAELIYASTTQTKSSIPVQDRNLGPTADTISTIEKLITHRETISQLESELADLRASMPARRTQPLPKVTPEMSEELAIEESNEPVQNQYRPRIPQF